MIFGFFLFCTISLNAPTAISASKSIISVRKSSGNLAFIPYKSKISEGKSFKLFIIIKLASALMATVPHQSIHQIYVCSISVYINHNRQTKKQITNDRRINNIGV